MIEQPMENRKWFQKRDLSFDCWLVGAARRPFYFFGPKNRERQRSSLKRAGSFTAST